MSSTWVDSMICSRVSFGRSSSLGMATEEGCASWMMESGIWTRLQSKIEALKETLWKCDGGEEIKGGSVRMDVVQGFIS